MRLETGSTLSGIGIVLKSFRSFAPATSEWRNGNPFRSGTCGIRAVPYTLTKRIPQRGDLRIMSGLVSGFAILITATVAALLSSASVASTAIVATTIGVASLLPCCELLVALVLVSLGPPSRPPLPPADVATISGDSTLSRWHRCLQCFCQCRGHYVFGPFLVYSQ